MTEIVKFIELLRDTIGLGAASIGVSAIERAIQDRRVACRIADLAAYWDLLRSSESELQELIEAVVVSETWFFRDPEAATALARMALEEWSQIRPDGVLRLLSLPCSSGEEPYSIAMAMLDAGLPPCRFQIDAVDISARVLHMAERAVYGRNSFRSNDLTFRDRYFRVDAAGAWLNEAVRQQVRFQQGNLLSPEFLKGASRYDAIFCRNLLIYFDRENQDRSIRLLERLMTKDGVVFVGPSETALLLSHQFVPLRLPLAFAFRKASASCVKMVAPPPIASRRLLSPPVPVLRPKARLARAVTRADPAKPNLETAERLADAGRLMEATTACEAYMSRFGPSAEAFYLMGLIRDAAGNPAEAERQYRKALYLDHSHESALTHLALLLERRGELAAARVLSNRAARASAR